MSYTYSESTVFTISHARHIVAKVGTDLKRIQRFYYQPSDDQIVEYVIEAIELVKAGYLDTVTYGFWRNGNWIEPTVRYTAREIMDGRLEDDDPGKIRPGASVEGASFYSYLNYSYSWRLLTTLQKDDFKSRLPFQRATRSAPGVEGRFIRDLIYSAGGRALNRSSLRSF